METVLLILAIVAGFVLLVWGADRFVDGASGLAQNFGVSPLVIGLTIVGFGTSAPEMLIGALASMDGAPALAVGNAIGSNIANIGLVLGITLLVRPLIVNSDTLCREFPVLGLVMLLVFGLMYDQHLSRFDGGVLFIGFVLMLAAMTWLAIKSSKTDPLRQEFEQELTTPTMTSSQASIKFIIGLLTLLIGSKILVWGAVGAATLLGVSELIIGLTIVAIGTSLPELASSISAVLKAEPDIAIGNIIGSNIFNLLAVLAMPGLIAPSLLDPAVLTRDYVVMVLLAVLLFLFISLNKQAHLGRFAGGTMLLIYISYNGFLAYQGSI